MLPGYKFLRYKLETEYTLTWYPVSETGVLNRVKMHGAHLTDLNLDYTASAFGTAPIIDHHTDMLGVDDERLISSGVYRSLNNLTDLIFIAKISITLGNRTREKTFTLQPGTITPFMLQIGNENDDSVKGTQGVLQGVFSTTSRIDVMRQIIAPLAIIGILAQSIRLITRKK